MGSFEEFQKPSFTALHASSVTASLASTSLFQLDKSTLNEQELTAITYKRAKAIARAYDLTAQDIVFLKSKFWGLHTDQICSMDGEAATLLTIQYNLVAGTLAPFAFQREELQPLLQDILDFDVSSQFLLSEVGHGLDSPHLETTATLLPTGEFDLHTPSPLAAKWTSTTSPTGNIPRVAIVIAQLMIAGVNHGVRAFIVSLDDGKKMCSGITTKIAASRTGGTRHGLTYFDHVYLPYEALLGSLEMPKNLRQNFLEVIWRVGIGSLASSNMSIAAFKTSAYVAGRHSIRRRVTARNGTPMPAITFRPQQAPIMHAVAQAFVLEAYGKYAASEFKDPRIDPRIRHGIAATLRTIVHQHCQNGLYSLAERCGGYGLFEYNQVIENQLSLRAVALAEGDGLALCIRLASELLIGRYGLPSPADPSSFLARHETGLFDEARAVVIRIGEGHNCETFNRLVLPLCQPLIEAIGHRMAYEAAVARGVDSDLIALYVAGAMRHDESWYVEHLGITRRDIAEMEDRALSATFPRLETLLEQTGSKRFCTAPMVTDKSWAEFVDRLPGYEGDAAFSAIPGTHQAAACESPFSRL